MASLTRVTSLTALAAVLVAAPAAFAQSQADLDACNQQAAAQAATGSAGAGGSITSSSPGTSVGGSVMTAPGSTDVNRVPNASGRISGSAGSPGAVAGTGTAGGAGTPVSPSTSMPSASPPTGGPSASTSASGSGASASASASTSSGAVRAGQNDPVYQQAFRDCLRRGASERVRVTARRA